MEQASTRNTHNAHTKPATRETCNAERSAEVPVTRVEPMGVAPEVVLGRPQRIYDEGERWPDTPAGILGRILARSTLLFFWGHAGGPMRYVSDWSLRDKGCGSIFPQRRLSVQQQPFYEGKLLITIATTTGATMWAVECRPESAAPPPAAAAVAVVVSQVIEYGKSVEAPGRDVWIRLVLGWLSLGPVSCWDAGPMAKLLGSGLRFLLSLTPAPWPMCCKLRSSCRGVD